MAAVMAGGRSTRARGVRPLSAAGHAAVPVETEQAGDKLARFSAADEAEPPRQRKDRRASSPGATAEHGGLIVREKSSRPSYIELPDRTLERFGRLLVSQLLDADQQR